MPSFQIQGLCPVIFPSPFPGILWTRTSFTSFGSVQGGPKNTWESRISLGPIDFLLMDSPSVGEENPNDVDPTSHRGSWRPIFQVKCSADGNCLSRLLNANAQQDGKSTVQEVIPALSSGWAQLIPTPWTTILLRAAPITASSPMDYSDGQNGCQILLWLLWLVTRECSATRAQVSPEHHKYSTITVICEVPCVSILVTAHIFVSVKNLHHSRSVDIIYLHSSFFSNWKTYSG